MDHRRRLRTVFLFQDFHGVRSCFPAVNNHRKGQFLRQFKLSDKPLFLNLMTLFIPVIIQSGLSDRHNLLLQALLPKPCKRLFIQFSHFIRMDTCRSIHKRIFPDQFHCPSCPFQTCPHIDHCPNAVSGKCRQNLLLVPVICMVVIMCMTVKYHISLLSRRI